MADVLTSYAKVFGDLFVSTCMFFSGSSSTGKPDRGCGGQYLVPLIISIPSVIRLRQCLIEYLRVRRDNKRSGGLGASGWGGQHLANAAKYSSAFPVVILSAMQRGYDPTKIGISEKGLFRLWYASSPLPKPPPPNIIRLTSNYKALLRLPKLILLLLLGRLQRLGPNPLLPLHRAQQPRTSMGPTTPSTFPHKRNLLRRRDYRFNVKVYMEFQTISTFRPFQRFGRWHFRDGVIGGFEEMGMDFLSRRGGMG